MAEKLILAVDLGTSGVKLALVTLAGEVVAWETEAVQLLVTPDGGAEQIPGEWWTAFLTAAQRLLTGGSASRVHAVCCSTQGEGTVPVDRDGEALGNCITWMDMRGASHLKDQLGGLINIDGASVGKVFRFIRYTGGMPSMTGKDPAGHMLFIRDTQPEIYAKTHKFLNVLDFLNLKLTGRFVATFDSILTSWVTDNRDSNAIRYNSSLISTLGIDSQKLPEIVPCTEVIGNVKPDIAGILGLSDNVKVIAGSIDNTASAIGSGAVDDFTTHLYIGTSSWLATHVPFKKTDIFASLASVPCALPNRYLMTALQTTAGGNLTYLRDQILYHQDELLQEADVPDIFKVLDKIAARVPAGANGVIYTPWIWGERAPVDDKTIRAGLYNLSLNNYREDIIRAILEGVALNTRWLLSPVEKFLKRKVDTINIVGGGAQSDVWCQIFADVLNVRINQVADPIYANVRGAAWIASVGMGDIAFKDIPKLVRIKRQYSPQSENQGLYKKRFKTFISIYKKMAPIYKSLNV